jgi:hypothetical protein
MNTEHRTGRPHRSRTDAYRMPMEGVYWSDWGEPRRLLLDLARFGHQSSQEPSKQAMPLETTMLSRGQCDGRADRASAVGRFSC